MIAGTILNAFAEALHGRNIVVPRQLIADGKLHRCDAAANGKRGKDDAAYILFDDGLPAGGFQNWRDGQGWQDWHAALPARKLSAEQRDKLKRQAEEARRQREEDAQRRYAAAAARAAEIWEGAATAVNGHAYLAKKHIEPHGTRLYRDRIVVPVGDLAGELRSLQFIDAAGGKKFLTGGAVRGYCHVLGAPTAGGVILLAEGFGTAATLHEATGHPVIIAFNDGNLPAVAKAVRQYYPRARLIVAADDDHLTEGNPGVTKARAAAQLAGAGVAIPEFGDDRPDGFTDFNDLGRAAGHDAVRAIIERALATLLTTPTIVVRGGQRHNAADAALAALAAAHVPFYQRDRIVRVCQTPTKTIGGDTALIPSIVAVGPAFLARALGSVAIWQRPGRKGDLVRIDPARDVVEQIGEMAGEWPFPTLAGVTATPTLRPDGSLLIREGYDAATGLVLIGAPPMPPIAARPTKRDAEAALALLDALLDEFPFRAPTDRAVALSQLITPVLRGAMPAAPMHLVNAPQAGTGKSYLATLASTIATGERCAVVAFSADPKETGKRLTAHALAGYPLLALDNVSGTLECDLLCQMTEQPLLNLRPLGTTNLVRVANTFTVFANGNNSGVAADMVRRTIQCGLDANMEAPEERKFTGDPLGAVNRDRGAYIAAILTMARAYICAGQPERLAPLPSYEVWSDFVRSPLVWLGRDDPAASMTNLRQADPVQAERATVFTAWAKALSPGSAYVVAELIEHAKRIGADELHAAFVEIAHSQSARANAPAIDALRLSHWLRKAENSIAAGLKLTCDRRDNARPRWLLDWIERRG